MGAGASGVRAGRAYVELGVDSSALAKGLNAAASRLKAFGAGISNIGKGLMAAGTAVTAPLTLMAKSFADGGSRILEMSKRTGVSVEALSALGYAAQRSGADMDSLEAGLRKMQRSIVSAASGSQTAQETFSLLGLDINKLAQMNPEEQFKSIADALAGITDPTLRAAMAMQVLGRGGTALLPMMEQGAAGIEMMEEKAKALGLVSTTQGAQSAKSLSVAFADFAAVSKKTSSILGSALADTLRETTQWITDLVVKMNAFIKTHKDVVVAVFKVAKVVFAVGVGLVVLGTVVSKVGAGLAVLAKVVSIGASVFGVMGSILAWILSPIGLVITAVVALGSYILYSTGLGAKALDWLGARFSGLMEDATAAWQGIGDALAAGDIGLAARILWLTLKMEFAKGVAYLQSIWLDFKQWFIKVAFGAFYGVQAAWEIASHGLTVAWIETTAFLAKVWTNFSAGVQSVWDGVTQWVSDRMLEMQGAMDDSFDVNKAKQLNAQQSQANQTQIEQERQGNLDKIESDRAARRQMESKQHESELGKIGQEYDDAVSQAAKDNAAKMKAAQEDIDKAKGEWQAALAEAKKKREEKDAGKGLGKPEGPAGPKGKLANLGDLLNQASQRTVGVRGTFSAMEVRGLQAGGVSDRLAKASESTAKNTKAILEELRDGGAEFE